VPEAANEQAYLAFPDGGGDVKRVTHIRSTLIMSSQKTLRDAGFYEKYDALLAPEHRQEVLTATTPRWLDLAVGMAHYQACDDLGLGVNQVVDLGQAIGSQRKGTFLGVAVNLASGLGVTPWTALAQTDRIWRRGWLGGAMRAQKVNDQEARVEVVGWPCARIPYCRHALRGLMLGVAQLLAPQAFVHEIHALQRDASLAYRLTWR
jgi:hypothetical protein